MLEVPRMIHQTLPLKAVAIFYLSKLQSEDLTTGLNPNSAI